MSISSSQIIEGLQNEIEKIHTENLDISFNELLDMYDEGELKIDPEFQRLFRWTPGASSRLIESLLLQMPIPPMYVVETEENKYELIDGLQRFSSYLHLRGRLESEDKKIKLGDKLKLQDCDIVDSLNGHTYEELPTTLQIRLRRSFVRVVVIKHGSDPTFKYHMFKRLNTGGLSLSDQELRNCTIRLLDSNLTNFLRDISKSEDFQECIKKISKKEKSSGYASELALRFFALKNDRESFNHDIADYLTEYMEKVALNKVPFDYQAEKSIFKTTFKVLRALWGSAIFGRLNQAKDGLTENFSVYQFEALTLGIQKILKTIDLTDLDTINDLKNKTLKLKGDKNYLAAVTGGGKNTSGDLRRRVEKVEEYLK